MLLRSFVSLAAEPTTAATSVPSIIDRLIREYIVYICTVLMLLPRSGTCLWRDDLCSLLCSVLVSTRSARTVHKSDFAFRSETWSCRSVPGCPLPCVNGVLFLKRIRTSSDYRLFVTLPATNGWSWHKHYLSAAIGVREVESDTSQKQWANQRIAHAHARGEWIVVVKKKKSKPWNLFNSIQQVSNRSDFFGTQDESESQVRCLPLLECVVGFRSSKVDQQLIKRFFAFVFFIECGVSLPSFGSFG